MLNRPLLLVTVPNDNRPEWLACLLNEWPATRIVSVEHDLVREAQSLRGSVILIDGLALGVSGLIACHRLSLERDLRLVPKIFLARTYDDELAAFEAGAHSVLNGEPRHRRLVQLVKAMIRLNTVERMENQSTQLKLMLKTLEAGYDATIEGWVKALDLRDRETEEHSIRVAHLTRDLAKFMGIDEAELTHIYRGALLHDIGKLGIPDSILQKAGALDDEERALINRHPEFAARMLAEVSYLNRAAEIPYAHHERWDGQGYPNGLAGEEIPLSARIFSVVDVYDALRFDRPYRKGWPEDRVMEHLREGAGTQFDPLVVDAFLNMLSLDKLELPA